MKRLLFTMILAGAMLFPAQTTGEMLFSQGCDAFDLVEDLGEGPDGATRWVIQSLKDGAELILAFDGLPLIQAPSEDPTRFSFTQFVAGRFEGTGVRFTNRTRIEGTILDELFNITGFFEGETLRGTVYKTGGISGTFTGNLATGELVFDAARVVLCRAGFGG